MCPETIAADPLGGQERFIGERCSDIFQTFSVQFHSGIVSAPDLFGIFPKFRFGVVQIDRVGVTQEVHHQIFHTFSFVSEGDLFQIFKQFSAFFGGGAGEKFEQCLQTDPVIFFIDHGDITGDSTFHGESLKDLHEETVDGGDLQPFSAGEQGMKDAFEIFRRVAGEDMTVIDCIPDLSVFFDQFQQCINDLIQDLAGSFIGKSQCYDGSRRRPLLHKTEITHCQIICFPGSGGSHDCLIVLFHHSTSPASKRIPARAVGGSGR